MNKLPYRKMLEAIDAIVNNDWGFEVIDLKCDMRDLTNKDKYYKFTQKEAIEMSKALGKIYQISHCLHCCCKPQI